MLGFLSIRLGLANSSLLRGRLIGFFLLGDLGLSRIAGLSRPGEVGLSCRSFRPVSLVG